MNPDDPTISYEHHRDDPDHTPEHIGPFKIIQRLGDGGFGVVYEAQQTEPIKRRVALKVIKPGMDSAAVLTRFEAERQALAVMDHPCIAKVFDAGMTDQGRPYFAMELVRGEPLTDFCDRNRIALPDRLTLFMRICEAVQHAHTKGVVHRDLKPSNILVSYHDDEITPKVIDFGIAKALHQKLSDQSLYTQQGQLIGTPEYMSPEQAEMGITDIDTRSDIYSLGVILYELLTGARPFESETLRRAGLAEIQRIIRETDPPKPSTRLASIVSHQDDPDTATRIAHARRTELRSLSTTLRRDLDWVVMKCLEKDRARRYDAASELEAEIDRYLRDEPVLAGPPGVMYRVQKFTKRNRRQIVIASVFLAVLVTAALGIGKGLGEARKQRQAALEMLGERDDALKTAQLARSQVDDQRMDFKDYLYSLRMRYSDVIRSTIRDASVVYSSVEMGQDGGPVGGQADPVYEIAVLSTLRTIDMFLVSLVYDPEQFLYVEFTEAERLKLIDAMRKFGSILSELESGYRVLKSVIHTKEHRLEAEAIAMRIRGSLVSLIDFFIEYYADPDLQDILESVKFKLDQFQP